MAIIHNCNLGYSLGQAANKGFPYAGAMPAPAKSEGDASTPNPLLEDFGSGEGVLQL